MLYRIFSDRNISIGGGVSETEARGGMKNVEHKISLSGIEVSSGESDSVESLEYTDQCEILFSG